MTSRSPRGLLFGSAAESYERFRLGYPDEVVDRTLAFAGRPVRTAVEVGAGTGKATRVFASHGVSVTALEPDPDMYAVLVRETAGMRVEPVPSSYEDYRGERVDVVYAAAAWHWTDPATRLPLAADLLAPGGVLAVFGGPMRLADPAVQDAVAAVCPEIEDPSFQPHAGPPDQGSHWPTVEMQESAAFADVCEHHLPREVVVPKKEYVGYLSTLSAYLQLDVAERDQVLHAIADVVPAQVVLDLGIGLHLARRS